jgi:hypothetical protein
LARTTEIPNKRTTEIPNNKMLRATQLRTFSSPSPRRQPRPCRAAFRDAPRKSDTNVTQRRFQAAPAALARS